jgi:cytidine deaminase
MTSSHDAWQELARVAIARARMARMQAHAPYSNYQVGAALIADDGCLHDGCNVENASYGLTICAERTAVVSAVAHGHRRFQLLAVATADAAPPCGACLQVLAEFCDDLPIVLVNATDDDAGTWIQLSRLLPLRFR